MKNIKQYFTEFRSTTPRHIQWLLLVAAFVVVLILIVLLFGVKSNSNEKFDAPENTVSFLVEPNRVDFIDTIVGESKKQNLNINVNTPVVIDGITVDSNDITTMNNCDNLTNSCLVKVVYKPTNAQPETTATLKITWHVLSQTDIVKIYEVPVVFSALKKPEPIVESEPVVESIAAPETVAVDKPTDTNTVIYDDFDNDNENDYDDEVVVQNQIQDEIQAISDPDVFKKFEPEPDFSLPPEKCSDFAIPGYNPYGVQIGWIKPSGGANYFHPFSDTDCSNPTGRYDFATGIITSLEDGSRMGTDANHIGYRNVRGVGLSVPALSAPASTSLQQNDGTFINPVWLPEGTSSDKKTMRLASSDETWNNDSNIEKYRGSSPDAEFVVSSRPYDRTFILRQFKPIPATIVSEVRADPSVYGCTTKTADGRACDSNKNYSIPVRATVDRNVFSDDGRTIIIPTGTLLMGYLSGELPGPYQSIGRMNIKWYQFIRPDGVEFNFKKDQDPYSADAQGRVGVPGHGSTDYIEQMVMPILTSLVPAAVNMIAPIADTVINQINLDDNTIVQSGTVRSSEMAKQEIISTWNKVAQKLLVDVMANTIPPFSIAAGTRINVYSPVDLAVTCGDDKSKKCYVQEYATKDTAPRRKWSELKNDVDVNPEDASWIGQVRSFDLQQYCEYDNAKNKWTIKQNSGWMQSGYEYRTVYAYCESMNYEAINNARQNALYQNQKETFQKVSGGTAYSAGNTPDTSTLSKTDTQTYNKNILGLTYNEDGTIENPFANKSSANDSPASANNVLTCEDGLAPDANGCCTGETYTDMGDAGWNCCPDIGGDCFPPITVQ